MFVANERSPTLGLYGIGPATCIRRITPEGELDEAWTPDLTTWTGGRPVMVFRYMREGKAVGTVLHVDEVDIDFSAAYDPDVAAELDAHYRLWLFDLDAETARPIEDVDNVGSGFAWSILNGRTFLFAPEADWSSTHVYELDTEGVASRRFEATGFHLEPWGR